MRRTLLAGLAIAALALVARARVASAQTVDGAQCGNGDIATVGNACTTSDGGAGTCFAEMCSMVDDGGTDLGPCALCYAPGEEPPGDGGAIVVISTTTTTSSDDGGCRVGGVGSYPASYAGCVLLVGALASCAVRRNRPRAVPPCARRDREDGGDR